jgi:hypothetical protein
MHKDDDITTNDPWSAVASALRRLATPVGTVPLALVVVLAVACGSGGEPSAEEYFTQVDEIAARADLRSSELGEELDRLLALEAFSDEDRAALRVYIEAQEGLLSDFVTELEDLDVPEVAQPAHNEMVAAFTALRDAFDELPDRTASVQSPDDITEELLADVISISQRATAACLQLEQVAEDEGFAISLECEGGDD